ncbi:OmpA family protein [Haliangium ochraceum]|uniref:OmpA family protein n=1 Tax=Haliangium ochraceum TaxID=80816 RepID=UPI00019BA314|nr:OmpA family protein [Haliangium ochraceum]
MSVSRGDIAIGVLIAGLGVGFLAVRAAGNDTAVKDDASAPAVSIEAEPAADTANADGEPNSAEARAEAEPEAAAAGTKAAAAAAADEIAEEEPEDDGSELDIYAMHDLSLGFGVGEASPRQFEGDQIARLGRSMRACSGTIEVTGHTDASGSRGENRRISEDRARLVQAMLIQAGVDAALIEVKGVGGDDPIASNDTAAGRAKNRRVTVTCRP